MCPDRRDLGSAPGAAAARHIGNAVLREDARGARLAKERKGSPRMIDAAVASVLAHDRAAALAGVTRHTIYF